MFPYVLVYSGRGLISCSQIGFPLLSHVHPRLFLVFPSREVLDVSSTLSRATHPRSLSVRIQFVGALFLLTYHASPSDLDYCLALFNPSMEVSSLAALGIRSPNFYVLIGAGDSIPHLLCPRLGHLSL